jgi:hypothetical protein
MCHHAFVSPRCSTHALFCLKSQNCGLLPFTRVRLWPQYSYPLASRMEVMKETVQQALEGGKGAAQGETQVRCW